MKIETLAVLVKLEDGKVYQVALSREKCDQLALFIAEISGGTVAVLPDELAIELISQTVQ